MVSWEYILKRRGWTISEIVRSLPEPEWNLFCGFFRDRGIECPPKSEFNKAVKAETPKPAPKKKPPTTKKKTTSRRRASTKKTGKPKT